MDAMAETVIERPRADVAAYAMDAGNEPEWYANILETRPLDGPPLGLGSRATRVAAFMGRRIEYDLEVVEHDPPARIVMASTRAPFPMRVTYEFEARGPDRTLARIRLGGGPRGALRLLDPLMARVSRRNIEKDLASLKRRLEARPAPPPRA